MLLGIVIGAAGLGNALGIGVGSLLRRVNPAVTVVAALLADAAVVLLAALFYGVVPIALLGLTAGLAQALAKLSLDATIQRDVPERVQSSAFARSDTTLQLAWVLGRLPRHRAAAASRTSGWASRRRCSAPGRVLLRARLRAVPRAAGTRGSGSA